MKKELDLVPSWVYSMADYCQIFDLSDEDLTGNILDYPAGISSFNAEMQAKGRTILSGDPMYDFSYEKIAAYAEQLIQINAAHLREHSQILRQSSSQLLEVVLTDWEKSKRIFLEDYKKGKIEERYKFMKLPHLPFEDYTFDIALCSAHLFHTELTRDASREALVKELCRVSKEVRVFPLLDEKGSVTDALGRVMLNFQKLNYGIKISEVPYHQMKGGNAMLKIWTTECVVD